MPNFRTRPQLADDPSSHSRKGAGGRESRTVGRAGPGMSMKRAQESGHTPCVLKSPARLAGQRNART
jgi:hypothetical protein